MWADLINKEKIHRVLWCALYMAVTVALQTTVFAHIALFGVHAMFVPAVGGAGGPASAACRWWNPVRPIRHRSRTPCVQLV